MPMQSGTRKDELNGIIFRRAQPADAERLAEFAARSYYETFWSTNTPQNMHAYLCSAFTPPQLEAELCDSRAKFFLAETDGCLVGYAKLFSGDVPECVGGAAPIELVRFYVDSGWHGSGLAAALMEECLAEAKRDGFGTMYLGVWEHNLRAQAFYRKWNFERVGQHI